MDFTEEYVDYDWSESPPPLETRDSYYSRARSELRSLLSQSDDEQDFQHLLERYPILVPGVNRESHSPIHRALFSQPYLPGLTSRVPDFMWIVTNSATVTAVLVEIERPGKKMFNQDGGQSAAFTQALGQLSDWRNWSHEPTNVDQFRTVYRLDGNRTTRRNLRFSYILVYGRRAEFGKDSVLADRRSAGQRSRNADEVWMSWDRLSPQEYGEGCLTVKVGRSTGEFKCIYVPDRVMLGPSEAADFVKISGKQDALARNAHLSEARRRFLGERFSYWDRWAHGRTRGHMSVHPHRE